MKTVLTLTFLGMLFFGISTVTKGQTIPGNAKIEQEIDTLFTSLVHAAEILDINKIANSVNDIHKAGFITNGVYYDQFDALIQDLRNRAQGDVKQSITIQKKKIAVISSSIVLLSATGVSEITINGGNPITRNFIWSFVFEKINNQWKVIQSHQ